MEEQEISARSGKIYRFIPVNRKDLATKTGHPKYLPVDTCKNYGINCEPIMKHKDVRSTERTKRGVISPSVFTNIRGMHHLADLKDINIARYMERKKISNFTNGLIKAGEKLFDRSPG